MWAFFILNRLTFYLTKINIRIIISAKCFII
jgi:hypothetical protein